MVFRNRSGISVESFLEPLSISLNSTYVGFKDDVFLQNSGVCIGSKVAPLLCYICLCKVDRALKESLSQRVKKVFRYVYEYLVIVESRDIF